MNTDRSVGARVGYSWSDAKRVGYKVRRNKLHRVVDGDNDGERKTDYGRAVVGMVQSNLAGCTPPDRRDGHSHLYLVCPLFCPKHVRVQTPHFLISLSIASTIILKTSECFSKRIT